MRNRGKWFYIHILSGCLIWFFCLFLWGAFFVGETEWLPAEVLGYFLCLVVIGALGVSGCILLSASRNASHRPRAMRAPLFRTAAMTRFSTRATRQPRARAISAVRSVETLSAKMTSTAAAPPT